MHMLYRVFFVVWEIAPECMASLPRSNRLCHLCSGSQYQVKETPYRNHRREIIFNVQHEK